MQPPEIGTYLRYSTELQRPTSIEDQRRTCLEALARHGYDASRCRHFADEAISGSSEKTDKRTGLKAFLSAWDNGEFDVVIVDEVSRLARAPRELAEIQERITRTGVRFLTANGLDSTSPTFSLTFGVTAAIATHFLEETRHRVKRGMKGQLERGFMIAPPAYGYRHERVYRDDGTPLGTNWHIDEAQANIVRQIYAKRVRGESYNSIAEYLNRSNIATPRKPKKETNVPYWRAGTVFRLVKNPIYRGIMILNGSVFARTRAKKQKRTLEPIPYFRPELRIIDDATWETCNAVHKSWPRGGGTSPFAGIVKCNQCDGTLTISHGATTKQLYCSECFQAARVGARPSHPGHASVGGLQAALRLALREVLSPAAIEEFQARLRARLTGGSEAELASARKDLVRLDHARKQYLALIDCGAASDEEVMRRYALNSSERQVVSARIAELERRATAIDTKAIQAQLSVDPSALVDILFESGFPPERLRAMITRVFPHIAFLGKHGPGTAEYELEVAPGVVLAEASGTDVIDTGTSRMIFRVKMKRTTPIGWIAMRVATPSDTFVRTERPPRQEGAEGHAVAAADSAGSV